jgi:hypothetical protein
MEQGRQGQPRPCNHLGFALGQGRLAPDTSSAARPPALTTDRWFSGVFQSAPDLIRWLAASPDGLLPDGTVPDGTVPGSTLPAAPSPPS